jgi:hypothetical protein
MAHIAAMGIFASQRGNLARTPAMGLVRRCRRRAAGPFHPHWRIAARLQCKDEAIIRPQSPNG